MSNAKMKTSIDGTIITFTPQYPGQEPVSVDARSFPPEVFELAAIKGILERLRDSYNDHEPEHCRTALLAGIQTLSQGIWGKPRAKKSGVKATDLALAVSRVQRIPIEEAIATLTTLREQDPNIDSKLRRNLDISVEMTQISLERKKAARKATENTGPLDLSSLLAP